MAGMAYSLLRRTLFGRWQWEYEGNNSVERTHSLSMGWQTTRCRTSHLSDPAVPGLLSTKEMRFAVKI